MLWRLLVFIRDILSLINTIPTRSCAEIEGIQLQLFVQQSAESKRNAQQLHEKQFSPSVLVIFSTLCLVLAHFAHFAR